jgi:UDP-N-acetylglucosamine 2-epimerase (non-hydrolysing)
MKIMTVVGARPNFMKAAPIIAAIREYEGLLARNAPQRGSSTQNGIQHLLVHTGQHYDALMSDSFFADLNLPRPDVDLNVGSGSHAAQTAEIMTRFEGVLLREKPDILVVVGDVNSTVACALVAAKISYDQSGARPMIAHVEAGLRSFDRTMPEEINRVITDQLSDMLFVTEKSGLRNLACEGIAAEKVHFVGNTMIDSLLTYREKAESSLILDVLGLRTGPQNNSSAPSTARYALLTLHRPANVDSREVLLNILGGIAELAGKLPVIFPAHPRTQNRVREFGLDRYFQSSNACREPSLRAGPGGIRILKPLGYLDFLCLMKNATLVVTDSGGIQEETTCLGIPCVTVRDNTERPVTVEKGTNILAGTTEKAISAALRKQMARNNGHAIPEKWDGKAAARIVDILVNAYREWTPCPIPQAPPRLSAARARSFAQAM